MLCPAKNVETAKNAILSGADAVYIGADAFGARSSASNSTEEIAETRDMVLGYTLPYFNPYTYISFTDEEQKTIDMNASGITTYANEMITKFILGQAPLSKFDEFRSTLYEMGLEELLKTYEGAYNRMKG